MIVGSAGEWIASGIILLLVIALLVHCPIFKPWFGFRKPNGHPGRWWT